MKKIISIISILTLGFVAFADEVELKSTETLVAEITTLVGAKGDVAAYATDNYDSIYNSYINTVSSVSTIKEFIELDKTTNGNMRLLYRRMILVDGSKFTTAQEGEKNNVELCLPLFLTTGVNDKAVGLFSKMWVNSNAENIATSWSNYVNAEEKPNVSLSLKNLYSNYLKKNPDLLTSLSFTDVADYVPLLWIKQNNMNYETIKANGFIIDGISLENSHIFLLAKENDDYAYISTMDITGVQLAEYVNYMISKILILSDKEAYKATKTLESKLLTLNSDKAKTLLKKVQSVQDAAYLRVYREKQVQ